MREGSASRHYPVQLEVTRRSWPTGSCLARRMPFIFAGLRGDTARQTHWTWRSFTLRDHPHHGGFGKCGSISSGGADFTIRRQAQPASMISPIRGAACRRPVAPRPNCCLPTWSPAGSPAGAPLAEVVSNGSVDCTLNAVRGSDSLSPRCCGSIHLAGLVTAAPAVSDEQLVIAPSLGLRLAAVGAEPQQSGVMRLDLEADLAVHTAD